MGQAKKRGNKDQRIAQALEKPKKTIIDPQQDFSPYPIFTRTKSNSRALESKPPVVGTYIATKLDVGWKIYVSDVSEQDEDGFFLITLINDMDKDDTAAIEDEITSDEWWSFAGRFGLILCESNT